ncbi:MAG: MBL fold metallo-hydrolase [Chloroflexi bacterium]|nr:MBL fold metallo-hydrolase [Chloroflexota bacterium]MBI3040847.1 MBL fold metallo-hydrolase [Chloroflexota bacterium]MBI3931302.1 MBL fold metallo-hydrolase [Chloroflexota bacterium]
MIPITEIVEGIFKIGPLDTHNGVTPWVAPYLVVGDDKAAIVEPGEGGQADELLQAIAGKEEGQLKFDLKRIFYLMPTHIHLHHVHSAARLLKELPNAKVVAHQRGAPHLVDPVRLNEGTLQVWGLDSGCPQIDPIPENRIIAVAGGEVFDLGNREIEVIESTGHAPHHVSYFDRRTRTLFPGDAAGAFFDGPGKNRTRPDILPPLFDVEKEIDSLHRLRALRPKMLLVFGHNALSHSPAKTMIQVEKDIRAVESIVLKGMRKKLSSREIGRQVNEYYDAEGLIRQEQSYEGSEETMAASGPPFGMVAYLKRKYPDLEIPK